MKQKLTFLLTLIMLLTTNAFMATGQNNYEKVTSSPSDWTGEYLLVYEADATTAYSWTGVDAANCYEEMTISGNSISASNAVTISIAAMEGGYSILVNGGTNNGKYIYGQSGSNTIKIGASPELNTLEYESDGVKITSYTSVMRFNNASNNLRFRYFKSTSYTNQQAVQLYKKNDGGQQQETVATPTFSPAEGSYFEPQQVTISCATEGATICYTTDGTDPNENSAQFTPGVPLNISETTTVKAKAYKSGYTPSNIASATYSFPELITIAEAKALSVNEYALVQGIVTFIDGRNVYVQDNTGGICLFLNSNTVPSTLALGDMVQSYGKRANYNGLFELSNINGGNASEFSIISSGNTLPLEVKTIAEVNAGGADALQCTRVKIEGATIGAINTSGNTPLTQGEYSTNIYKVPALTDINEGDVVDVIGVVGYFNAPQIRVALASDVTLNYVPDPQLTLTPTELPGFQYTFGEGPSQSLSFAVTGSDLTVNVSIAAPQDFEVATTAEGPFADNLSLTPVEGLVDANVYVRMKSGLAIGSYAGNVTVTTGTLNATVALSGTVLEDQSPVLNANPTSLSGFTYDFEDGGPSEVASFLLGGDNLTNNVAVYPSESFEVSTNVNFRPENPAMVYIPYSGHFYDISIYVRMKAGLEGGTYNEQIYAVSEGADTLFINVSGTVTGGTPTPPEPPTPGDGNYVRISDLNSLTDGAYVIVAARFDDNAADYYAMTAATTGKPTGVLFTSATSGTDEVLPASIVDEEETYYWVVGVTDNGYTFTNAAGDLIGYTSSTNFATGGDNTEWAITIQTSEEGAMVPNYTGFVINNVNNDVRAFALNSSHNFGPYHTQNMGGSGYNFFLDLFVKTEGGEPPVPTVATPTFTPEGGTYFEEQSVSIACATDGATIHYSTVSENGPWTTYNGAITVDESMTIWAYATKEGYNDSPVASATYTIQSGVVTIFNQDWEGEMNGWTFVSVDGEMEWTVATHQGNHYAYANGYSSGAAHANEDWCISPAFNLNAYSNPVLTFSTAKNYTGPDIEVFFSNNYNGTNPSAATWQPLTCALSTGSWTWVESGDIDLSSFSGTECYIGFKYTSTDEEAAGWEVDDIMLVGQTSEAVVTVTPLALTGFTYVEGNGPSAEQSFTVSGLNLNSNVVIAEATDYEISLLSGDDFTAQSTLTLSHDNGTIDGAVIYVRLKAGLAVGEYNDEDITITCADVDDIEVTCSGNVTAEPVPGDDYVRISDVSALVAGNRVILAARYDETADAYLAIANTPTSGKLTTTEFTSEMNGSDEIIPASILGDEDSYYWTVDVTDDGYTFTNANGDMIGYGNSGTNLVLNGEKTVWTITTGVSAPESLVPEYFGFNIINATTDTRAMALRVTDTESIVKAYATSNMTNGEYNFFLDIFMQGEGGVPPTPTVAAPVFTPGAGTYYETQDVTITCATADATIYYSLDSENGPWEEYEEAITVDESMTLWAYAEKEGYNDSPVVSAEYVIQNDLVIIFNQDWEEDWHGWTQVNVEGEDAEWTIAEHSGNHYAYMNGYNHGANEDWLISPAFDLDSYSDVVLTFITAMNYTGPAIEVLFSNDYDGTDPNAANWEPLTCELSSGSWAWTESGDITLDEFNGNNCYIAFKYICDENEAAAWEVDNILLVSGSVGANPTLTATPNTINGLDYIEGEGPSNSQSYTLTGSNLVGEGDVTLTASENFEISLDDEDFFTTLYVQYADGELIDQPVTIYVRLVEGLDVDTYTGTISHEGGEATTEVNVTGTVHSEDEPAMIAMMPYYIQGNNGSNNNRVPVAVAAYLYNLAPETTYRYVNQFVDSNDGPETAGAGNVIYANVEGFYRSTSPSLSTEGGYGEFTTDEDGIALVWFINEPTANARFTPGNEVYLRVRINDGNDGTTVENIFTSYDYATVLNFGTERDAYQGTAFYAKSNEPAMTFAMLHADAEDERPIYSTSIETTGVDYAGINQYADFYKELVAGKDGWFGGILPNNNKDGINTIMIVDMESNVINTYHTENGQWHPNANTSNPSAGLDEPIFIDLTDDGVDDNVEANVTVLSANHEFVIENGDNAHYMMTVYNVLGQPVMQKQINAGSTERISHNLATGIYVIRMENNQSRVSVKVLVM
ncbi:MAG: chitobiase/beta-hexosaminidase C-terminal domain-containing protein [Bacteroidales bacterium]|nr:chitobiase/beta-hexosaminidase C-terminal domain-containing protein [Bacteroidales bacterium]